MMSTTRYDSILLDHIASAEPQSSEEKIIPALQTPSRQDSILQPSELSSGQRRGIHGAKCDIWCATILIVVPLLACTVLLLLAAFSNNYEINTPASKDLLLGSDSVVLSDYLVIHNITASSLLTISSLTSNIAILLPSIVMTLSSYHVAGSLIKASESGDTKYLPTPYQLALLFDSLTGRLYSLWRGFLYKWWKRREKSVPALCWNYYLLLCALLLR